MNTRTYTLVMAIFLAIGLSACEDSPVNPFSDSMSATINGAAWSTSVASAVTTSSVTSITGTASVTSTNDILSLTLTGISAPGTYKIGGISNVSGQYKRDTVVYVSPVSQLVPTGSLTITQYGEGRVAGTFSFVAFRNGDRDTGDSISVTNGAFNVKLN